MCRTALAVLLLCAAAARSAELTVSPAYADVRGGQPLLLTLPSGTRWDLEEPHCLIGAPAAFRAHSAAALPAHGSRAAACWTIDDTVLVLGTQCSHDEKQRRRTL